MMVVMVVVDSGDDDDDDAMMMMMMKMMMVFRRKRMIRHPQKKSLFPVTRSALFFLPNLKLSQFFFFYPFTNKKGWLSRRHTGH